MFVSCFRPPIVTIDTQLKTGFKTLPNDLLNLTLSFLSKCKTCQKLTICCEFCDTIICTCNPVESCVTCGVSHCLRCDNVNREGIIYHPPNAPHQLCCWCDKYICEDCAHYCEKCWDTVEGGGTYRYFDEFFCGPCFIESGGSKEDSLWKMYGRVRLGLKGCGGGVCVWIVKYHMYLNCTKWSWKSENTFLPKCEVNLFVCVCFLVKFAAMQCVSAWGQNCISFCL